MARHWASSCDIVENKRIEKYYYDHWGLFSRGNKIIYAWKNLYLCSRWHDPWLIQILTIYLYVGPNHVLDTIV